jgi:formate dehydrogenase subunit delta
LQVETLVKMANQIATFYASQPDEEARIAGIVSHISRFWEPRMRRQLIAYIQSSGGPNLSPLAAAAARKLEPVPQTA